jgi:hypothetical protein
VNRATSLSSSATFALSAEDSSSSCADPDSMIDYRRLGHIDIGKTDTEENTDD